MLPPFDAQGLLPPGDHTLTIAQLRASFLVRGEDGRSGWDRAWRAYLVDNLEIMARQLWEVGAGDIFLGGSFVEDKDRPNDIDGYFLCDRRLYKSGELRRGLNAKDAREPWTWREDRRLPDETGKLKLPIWHHYRIELFPFYGQSTTGLVDALGNDMDYPAAFRLALKWGRDRGMLKLIRSK